MALAAGAYGGLITPSMMLGSTIAFTAAAVWNSFFPEMSSEARLLSVLPFSSVFPSNAPDSHSLYFGANLCPPLPYSCPYAQAWQAQYGWQRKWDLNRQKQKAV